MDLGQRSKNEIVLIRYSTPLINQRVTKELTAVELYTSVRFFNTMCSLQYIVIFQRFCPPLIFQGRSF